MQVSPGNIYRLNAPWHSRHGRLTFVTYSRIGVSPVYAGSMIFHIIDSDNFSDETDWDTEYLPVHFSDAGIDISLFMDCISKFGSGLGVDHGIRYMKSLVEQGIDKNGYCLCSNLAICGMDFFVDFKENPKYGSKYDYIPSGHILDNQLVSLFNYFDEGAFIEITPPDGY